MFNRPHCELDDVVERIQKRVDHLVEGGQEEGIKHANDLKAGIAAIKICAFRGNFKRADQIAHDAAAIERITSENAEDASGSGQPNPSVDLGKDAGLAGTDTSEVHTIAQELSGADKLITPAIAEGSLTQSPGTVNVEPAQVTPPPGASAEDVVKSPELKV